ncbi:MAG: DUF3572 domain-containing protein [Pseudomonadota bacterium]|jgi:hypothetical protein
MRKAPTDPRQAAEIVAIQALSFVARDMTLLGRFLAETGIGPDTLRASASDPQFLAGVLDFVLRDEVTVAAFATSAGLEPRTISAAREALGEPQWERDVP